MSITATYPITSPEHGPSTTATSTAPRAQLVMLEDDPALTAHALDAFCERYPRVPLGLVVDGDVRQLAVQWLRERRVDRLIPREHFEAGYGGHLDALLHHGARLDSLHKRLAVRSPKTLLVTGATGFFGGHFLRYLLRCGNDRIVALTRSTRDTPAGARLANLERLHPGRIRHIEGDLGQPVLGLSREEIARLSEEVDEIWHFAAVTRFEEILRDEILRVNVEGTRNLLVLAKLLPRMGRFHHVSTAYAAGNWVGQRAVPEARLRRPTSFKNPYEESKYLAEEIVAESGLPAVVYRPSIILGETVSGLCDAQTVYNVAKMLRLARLAGDRAAGKTGGFGSFRVVVDPEAAKNLISVDAVVDRMLRIAASEPEPGSYFNLTHDRPTPMTDLIAVIADLLDIPHYRAVRNLADTPLSTAESVLERVAGVFRPYMLRCDPPFDTRRATRAGGSLTPMDHEQLRFLLRAFFEQHYDWPFESVEATV